LDEAQRAKNLLNDEFFMGVVEKQRSSYIYNIVNSDLQDADVRESAYLKVRALDEFIATLQSLAQQPEIEKKRWKVF
jgi:hypothetical protein